MRSSILNPRSSTLLLLGALLTIPAIAQGQTNIRASFAGTTGYHLPIWVQKQEGLDKKYGLDMEILLIAGGSRIIQTLLSDELLLTHSGAPRWPTSWARAAW